MGAAYGAAGGTLGTVISIAVALIFLIAVYMAYRGRMNRQLRRDVTTEQESNREIYKILIWTLVPIVLSTVIYNIGTVLDQGDFQRDSGGQGYTEKQYVTIWGVYSGEFRVLMNVPLSIASCLAPSVVPSLAAVMSDNDTKEASIKVRDTIRYTMILTIPCAVGFLALSSPIMQLIFSDSTELASGIMQTGSLLIVLLGLSTLTTGILQGLGRMKEPMIHSAIALVLHLILLAILMTVFKLNIYGVLYSNIFFGLIMCILNAISIKKYLRYRQELVRTFIIPLVSSGIMGLAAYGVYNLCHLAVGNAISCLAAILVAIVVYGVVLIKLRGITERELYAIPKGAILVGVLKNADCCKKKPIQRAAILHDLCTVGKAAMTNILPVLSVLGVEACPVPTMVLSTHTGGYGKPAIYPLSGFAGDCGKHLKSQGFSFDAVFVGYLGNKKNVREAYTFLEDFSGGPVLFDPIMADHGKFYSNFDESYNELLKGLIPRCTLMTPNYTESCLLTGEAYEESCGKEKFLRITEKLKNLNCKNAVLTSIPLEDGLSARRDS